MVVVVLQTIPRPGKANSKQMDPRFHMSIPIWKWGLTHPHMEKVNHCFHMGIEKFRLPVSMWGSPYENGD